MQKNDVIKSLETAQDAPLSPWGLFGEWMAEAEKTEPSDHNAMCVATIGEDGMPQVRVILLKGWDEQGFVFYGNYESAKGRALDAHPVAALNFYWKSLGRQVRIDGAVEQVSAAESDAYYASRPKGSRVGAWASQQSRPLASRTALREAVETHDRKYAAQEDVPRPPHWGGWRVIPRRIEFWQAGEFRLHTRLVYTRTEGGWTKEMLYP